MPKEQNSRIYNIKYKCHLLGDHLYLYGNIGKYELIGDYITAQKVLDALNDHKGKVLNVHINSPGGSVFEAIAITNILKDSEKTINIVIDGLAASGAALITQAGNKVLMRSNALFLVHKASTIAYGTAEELRKIAEEVEKVNEIVIDTLKDRFNGSEEELNKLLEKDTYLKAEEVKKYGFIDEIITNEKKQREVNNMFKALAGIA